MLLLLRGRCMLVQVQANLHGARSQVETFQPGAGSVVQAALHLEVAMVHQYYRQAAAAQSQLDQAAAMLGVSLSVTGKWLLGMLPAPQLLSRNWPLSSPRY